MGMVTELFNVVSLATKAQDKMHVDPHDRAAIASLFSKAKSISAQASKYVMEYPVACSTVISSYKTALAIAKQVEFDCARFIILASGLNPIVRQNKGDTVETHISRLVSQEEFQRRFGPMVSITPATDEQIASGEEFLYKYYSQEDRYSRTSSGECSKLAYSREAPNPIDPYMQRVYANTERIKTKDFRAPFTEDDYEYVLGAAPTYTPDTRLTAPDQNDPKYANDTALYQHDLNEYEIQEEKNAAALARFNAENAAYTKARNHIDSMRTVDASNPVVSAATLSEINKKLGKVSPTIINLKIYVQGGDGTNHEVNMPLAIKATLQYVDALDINNMLKQVDSKTKKLYEFIRMTTGETKFFKDYLFALDSVKGDIERERVVGNTPFFRRLMSNKSKYRLKTVSETVPIFKKFVASKTQKDLPMCTIVIDESELRGLNLRLSDCLRNRQKWIDPILDTYMLLGLGVVDENNGIMHFFYSGEDYPVTCDITKLGDSGSEGNISSDLSKALANMSRLVTRR